MEKCYEYWGSENGTPKLMRTEWFEWSSDYKPPYQLGRKLKNFYRHEG